MSSIDLIILGYLQYGEKSAYEMVKEFETWNIHYWLKISNPAIYKNIIKLNENGYVNSRVVKEGEMPEKTIYSINEKGHLRFKELMEYSASNIGNIYLDFNAFVVNLNLLTEKERIQFLQSFKKQIAFRKELISFNLKKRMDANDMPPGTALLCIDLYIDLFDLLDKWSDRVMEKYNVPKYKAVES